jgi:hypothetical protein
MRLPWGKKPARASITEATSVVKQGALPFFFCFGCRAIIPDRPCDACDRETEIFTVSTETDRRLVTSRLPTEGA